MLIGADNAEDEREYAAYMSKSNMSRWGIRWGCFGSENLLATTINDKLYEKQTARAALGSVTTPDLKVISIID